MPFTMSAITATTSISQRLIIIVLSVWNAVAVRVFAVGADIVTDTIAILVNKVHATAAVITYTIAVFVYEFRACANVVTYTIAATATMTVLGSSNSCRERDQCNYHYSSHYSCFHFVFT
jgi:uncharacterized membrane protein